MGYYTGYDLSVQNVPDLQIDTLRICMRDLGIMEYFDDVEPFIGRNKTLYFNSSDVYKWYDHEEDMKKLSMMFPNAVFKLSGNGEDHTDLWDKYFYNGFMEYCPWTPVKPRAIVWRTWTDDVKGR